MNKINISGYGDNLSVNGSCFHLFTFTIFKSATFKKTSECGEWANTKLTDEELQIADIYEDGQLNIIDKIDAELRLAGVHACVNELRYINLYPISSEFWYLLYFATHSAESKYRHL